jgi:hypothetical protein
VPKGRPGDVACPVLPAKVGGAKRPFALYKAKSLRTTQNAAGSLTSLRDGDNERSTLEAVAYR